MLTAVARASLRPGTTAQAAECASACAYAFLGGVERSFATGSRLGLHQFSADGGIEPAAAIEAAQTAVAVVSAYVGEMGVSLEVVQIASATPPNEISWITDLEAARLGATTRDASLVSEAWEVSRNAHGIRMEGEFLQPNSRVVAFALSSCPIYLTAKGKRIAAIGSRFEIHFHRAPSEDWELQLLAADRLEFIGGDGDVVSRTALRSESRPETHRPDSSYERWLIDPGLLEAAFERNEEITLRLSTRGAGAPIEFAAKRTNFGSAFRRFRMICGF
jgi:hypothetical protein